MSRTGRPTDDAEVPDNPAYLSFFVFGLFFIFGGITSLNDVLVPKLKGLFTLNYFEAMLIQFAFFAAYAIISLPATAILKRVGYMRTAAIGLMVMTAGCLLFVPASSMGVFGMFLLALFVLAAGITTVQVVTNPLITMLGKPSSAHSRLTFAQAFNSLGTTAFPYVGSAIILGSLATVDPATLSGAALEEFRTTESQVISHAYLGLAAALIVIAIVVWFSRKKLTETPPEPTNFLQSFDLLRRPRFAWGALCIFLYVGGEVAIGSLIVNYLQEANVLGLSEEMAGKHVPYYWGGALVGRFIGAGLLRLFSPGKLLAVFATGVIALLLVSANTSGAVSGWSLLAIGLFNSIMFPTIFSLASEKLGRRAADGSGIICVAIVGGAFVPLLTGYVADVSGLKTSLMAPALCYAVILAYGIYARRPAADADIAPGQAPAASV